MRLSSMRFVQSGLLFSALILTAGCSAVPTNPASGPSPQETPATNAPGYAVATNAEAVNVGLRMVEATDTRWLEPPKALVIQQMSLAEAHKAIPLLSEGGPLPPETRVWLLVYQGRWQLGATGQTEGAPSPAIYEGCGFLLFTARDPAPIAGGDAACPPHN